jgi:hypothetical protein
VTVAGKDTGFDKCADGTTRRRAVLDCPKTLPRAGGGVCAGPDAGPPPTCKKDSDCTAAPNGVCTILQGLGAASGCNCDYGCTKDSECSAGYVCECGDPIGHCALAACTSGASCAAGFDCRSYTDNPGCPSTSYACQTPADQCAADVTCDTSTKPNDECTLGDGGAHVCQTPRCAIGRPFLVDGEARLAPAVRRDDWRGAMAPNLSSLDPKARARLRDAWVWIGRMEHASVGAFARFALQLLAVGAPPDLVLAAQSAMRDETIHARIAFGLASAYGGDDVGPGPLAMDGCLDGVDLAELAATAFVEGCAGETLAAIEAREALEHTADPAVRAALGRIAEDETAHAELAWRTVAWAIGVGGAPVRRRIEALLGDLDAELRAPRAGEDGESLLTHGIVGDSMRSDLRRAAIATTILPCARALLASEPAYGASTTGSTMFDA